MAAYIENFVAIRTFNPKFLPWRPAPDPNKPHDPEGAVELDYRDLLLAANEAYFHREYAMALRLYLELRQKILLQSHPELPVTPGITDDIVVDVDLIDHRRLVELSRRHLIKVDPGGQISLPADDRRLFAAHEVQPNDVLATFGELTVDPGLSAKATADALRREARRQVVDGDASAAERIYTRQFTMALSSGDVRLAADTVAESGAVLATYQADGADTRERAAAMFTQAAEYYRTLGDSAAVDSMTANLRQLEAVEPKRSRPFDGPIRIPTTSTDRVFLVPENGLIKTSASLVAGSATVLDEVRSVGVSTPKGTAVMSLDQASWEASSKTMFEQRIVATTLEELRGWDIVASTFVAYIPHLFFMVLPIAIADTYKALGQYSQAVNHYTSVLKYPYLNRAIEGVDLWMRLANTQLTWGDELFRRGRTDAARSRFEQIVTLPYAVPGTSPLYAPAGFSSARPHAVETVKKLKGEAHAEINPRIAEVVTAAARQLLKLDSGLNSLGLSSDYAPVLRFTYLQSAANYMADNAIQAERTFVQFRSQAEQQKLERLQLENAVALNEAASQVEIKRQEDAELEVQAATETLNLTEVRKTNAEANLQDWDTLGRELASVNAALAWASNAANDQDITYTNVRYHGESHDYSGDVEDFFDTVGEVREWLNFDIQRNRLARQIAESNAEIAVAETRLQQARVRAEVQQLNTQLAQVRLEGAQQVLEYAEDKMFDEDLWFRLAGEMQDLARGYLDMAIEAAYIMERAYALEFDRDLHRIRLDYGLSGPEGLLGGDHLKQDIASFTLDYIRHAEKQNPMRVPISMREEFPQAFAQFQASGVLAFRTDLEIFDRRYPGSARRKIKRVELFVEGLIPTNGISGTLQHAGISTEWRLGGAGYTKHNRVVPQETMVLSSYQFRRDYAVLTPREEVLTLFENLGPQANWTLVVWPSANDLDFASISDVTAVFYFDADYEADLATHTRALYGTSGGRSFVRSARLHEPDEYFRIERDREVTFHVRALQLPAWVTDAELTGFTVRLVPADGAAQLGVRELTVSRSSDNGSVVANTDADGVLAGAATTMAPFGDWLHDAPTDDFTVAFAEDDDLTPVVDVQLSLSYRFTYRADPAS